MDAINPRDEGFKMALAGGVTTAVTCPGNANPIGGTCAAIKTTGNTVEEMVMVPEIAIKMCLTDGVKNTYGGKKIAHDKTWHGSPDPRGSDEGETLS